jgi:hypothetical protein
MRKELFNSLSQWVESKKKDSVDIQNAHNAIKTYIDSTFSILESDEKRLSSEIELIKTKLSDQSTRLQLLSTMKTAQSDLGLIDGYLSSAFGRFSPEKTGQEVSWLWIDIALVSGVKDLMNTYMRIYNSYTPNSSVFFVNL